MAIKIGFIVEGDFDKVIVETLAARLLGPDFRPYAVRLGGEAALPWSYATVLSLLEEKHYAHVVVVLDADATQPADVERRRQSIEGTFARHQLGRDEVTVCLAVPQIEGWLLAGRLEAPEQERLPKERLRELLGDRAWTTAEAEAWTANLDLTAARNRAPSLDQFATTLERLATQLKPGHAA